jgi:hypothetical protein
LIKKKIKINKKIIEYKLQRRRKTRSVQLAIYADGNFVVTAPRWYPLYIIKKFIEEKSEWIFGQLKNIDFDKLGENKKADQRNYQANKVSVLAAIKNKVEFINCHYNFIYNRISIKNQKTCWGSASRKGNLNFNYKIINLPEELQNYIVVHELCHLKELNHGRKFWQLVAETMPKYKTLRKKLKEKSKIL